MSNVRIEDVAEGNVARVDSEGRLHTKSDCAGRTVTTTRGAFTDSTVVPISDALSECCFTSIMNHGPFPLRIAFENEDPVSGDIVIAALEKLNLPFPYATVIKGIGVGGGGTFVTIQAKQPK